MVITIKKDKYNLYHDVVNNFHEIFDYNTGEYIRTGIIENNKDTNVDPFMRSFPSLLDVGIMGGCKTYNVCKVGCYQGGKPCNPDNDMTFSNYKKIIDEGKEKGLQQVALGGAGNPNDHESFYDILKYTRDNGIVPNYTTSGINLTDSMAKWSKEFCGAAAVSWHYTQYSVDALHKFMHYGCKTNIHFVVNNKTIDDAIHLLEKHELNYDDKIFDLNKEKINAIIFLLYKPIGLGKEENMLTLMNDKDKISKFFMLINNVHPFSIGFDSCSIPGILNFSSNINPNSIDTCEGGRFSGYINAKMQMVPCSFDQKLKWSIDLNQSNIEDAWNSDTFNDFRNHMKNNCKECNYANECMGGCPIENKIVLCDNEKRRYNA